MSDLIDRQEAISRAVELRMYGKPVKMVAVSELERLPATRAELGENSPSEQPQMNELGVKTGETCADTINRQAAIEKFEPWLKVDGYSEGELNMLRAVLYELRFLPSAQPEERTETHACDCISRQAAIDALCSECQGRCIPCDHYPCGEVEAIKQLPSAQPERTCVNCGRTANNGGWYADGGTRCPIEEHYALPKDGYCHLWEKRNVTDDDYTERREE